MGKANDFGIALGTRAYLSSLRRTRIGSFKIEDAMSIETVIESIANDYNASRDDE